MQRNAEQVDALLALHAALLHDVVNACHDKDKQPALLTMLSEAEQNGWQKLCQAIREIIAGQRDESVLEGLDEEDAILIQAILIGIENPQTLPDIKADEQRNQAAAGLAATIQLACDGDQRAMEVVADMEKTFQANPDMASLANAIRKMINGERSNTTLIENCDASTRELIEQILLELKKQDGAPKVYKPWLN